MEKHGIYSIFTFKTVEMFVSKWLFLNWLEHKCLMIQKLNNWKNSNTHGNPLFLKKDYFNLKKSTAAYKLHNRFYEGQTTYTQKINPKVF